MDPRLPGDTTLAELAADRVGAPNWDAIDVLVGDELVVSGSSAAGVVGAIGLDDEESMRGALERAGYERSGEERGADVYEGGGPPVAIDDGVLLIAYSRSVLSGALRAKGEGRTFPRRRFDRAAAGLPREAPVRVYLSQERPELPAVDSLGTVAATVTGSDGAVTVDIAAAARGDGSAARLRARAVPTLREAVRTATGTDPIGAAEATVRAHADGERLRGTLRLRLR
jgi:hypothetical protein